MFIQVMNMKALLQSGTKVILILCVFLIGLCIPLLYVLQVLNRNEVRYVTLIPQFVEKHL
jgi:hypothetical protein